MRSGERDTSKLKEIRVRLPYWLFPGPLLVVPGPLLVVPGFCRLFAWGGLHAYKFEIVYKAQGGFHLTCAFKKVENMRWPGSENTPAYLWPGSWDRVRTIAPNNPKSPSKNARNPKSPEWSHIVCTHLCHICVHGVVFGVQVARNFC